MKLFVGVVIAIGGIALAHWGDHADIHALLQIGGGVSAAGGIFIGAWLSERD